MLLQNQTSDNINDVASETNIWQLQRRCLRNKCLTMSNQFKLLQKCLTASMVLHQQIVWQTPKRYQNNVASETNIWQHHGSTIKTAHRQKTLFQRTPDPTIPKLQSIIFDLQTQTVRATASSPSDTHSTSESNDVASETNVWQHQRRCLRTRVWQR